MSKASKRTCRHTPRISNPDFEHEASGSLGNLGLKSVSHARILYIVNLISRGIDSKQGFTEEAHPCCSAPDVQLLVLIVVIAKVDHCMGMGINGMN